MKRELIRVAHSPDSDDAFMFYGLASGNVDSGDLEFVHELKDIETLNQAALEGRYEVTAVSIHAYAYLHERYALLNSGASMGEGYGPKVITREPCRREDLSGRLIAIPGERTSAYLALRMFESRARTTVVPFDEILDCVEAGTVDGGVIIHEAQLFYADRGLHQVADLGLWWNELTGLPLPLGGNVVRRDLGSEMILRIARLLEQSIQYALDHREEALQHALQYGRGLDSAQGDRFVSMYVNDRTLDYGEDGRLAVQLFLDRGHEAGLIRHKVKVDFVIS